MHLYLVRAYLRTLILVCLISNQFYRERQQQSQEDWLVSQPDSEILLSQQGRYCGHHYNHHHHQHLVDTCLFITNKWIVITILKFFVVFPLVVLFNNCLLSLHADLSTLKFTVAKHTFIARLNNMQPFLAFRRILCVCVWLIIWVNPGGMADKMAIAPPLCISHWWNYQSDL